MPLPAHGGPTTPTSITKHKRARVFVITQLQSYVAPHAFVEIIESDNHTALATGVAHERLPVDHSRTSLPSST